MTEIIHINVNQWIAGITLLFVICVTIGLFINLYIRPRFQKKVVPTMAHCDKGIIHQFAAGNEKLKDIAIDVHRRYIPLLGVRGTPEMDFMAEIDHPMPDHGLRETYRTILLEENDDDV